MSSLESTPMTAHEERAGHGAAGRERASEKDSRERSTGPAAARDLGVPAPECTAPCCRADRLSSLGTAIRGVSHDLNGPLTSIKGFAQLMLMGDPSPDDLEALHTVAEQADRAATMVSDLRHMAVQAQAEELPREGIVLTELVRHVVCLRGYAKKGRRPVRLEHPTDLLPRVAGTRSELESAVTELLDGAEQAWAAATWDEPLILRFRRSHPGVAIEVMDHPAAGPSQMRAHYCAPFSDDADDDE